MSVVRAIFTELFGMFVDDDRLAIWALALIACVAAAVRLLGLSPDLGGGLLLVGCIAVLADSVRRATKSRS